MDAEAEDMFEEEPDPVTVSELDQSSDDFVEETVIKGAASKVEEKPVKKSKSKKRKAVESVESADSEEGSVCTICFEDWSNSGDHRISSLKCGHFFG